MNIGKAAHAALLPIVAILGTSLVSVALADSNCVNRISWPDGSQTNIVNDCASWTDCQTSQTCIPGTQYLACGTPTNVPQLCFNKINGNRDQTTGRCVNGVVVGGGPTSSTIEMYADPVECDTAGGGGGVS